MNTSISTPGREGSFVPRAYTTRGLARLYKVDERTLKKWLSPFWSAIGKKEGYYFTRQQVEIIIGKIGEP